MYKIEPFYDAYMIINKEEELELGPFINKSDAFFIVELLNNGNLTLNDKGEANGEESAEDKNAIY